MLPSLPAVKKKRIEANTNLNANSKSNVRPPEPACHAMLMMAASQPYMAVTESKGVFLAVPHHVTLSQAPAAE